MIQVRNLSYSFPQKDLYKDISFTIEDGQHCAFIGTSGSGKSTLVDMLMDQEKYMYDGEITLNPNCRIGYVSQFSKLEENKEDTVFEYIADKFLKAQALVASICSEMETSLDLEPLLEKYQLALDNFDALGGDDFESNINKKLNLANLLDKKDLLISQLSGGEIKLIQVIKEMLLSPDLMIMDEPDVFLDFENLNGLKDLINSHNKTLLIITHNRYLLNHCFNKIIHLENMELQEFDGRYIDYNFALLESKVELKELAVADDAEIERNEIYIEQLRDIATSHAESFRGRALNARVKIQERLLANRIKAPFIYIKQPHIDLRAANVTDDIDALTLTDYALSFEDVLLDHVDFQIGSREKVALIGPNGTGKTTLLREIFNNANNCIALGQGIKAAYLSQVQGEMLDESSTVLQEFFDIGFDDSDRVKAHISRYGLPRDFVYQKISALSGGEKNIIQLAKIACSDANLLLLDEPSSHLDTYSQLALEEALRNYKGAILMISHDFYSIANSMDYVLIIEDKKIRKTTLKKFKRMVYGTHFDKEYLELEQEKKSVETRIEQALKENNFTLANALLENLEEIVKQL